MTRKRIVKGNSNFEYLIRNNGYFIDKTLYIKEFMENGDYVQLTPRPRRFGKTLNLSMLEHFYDINKKKSAELFEEYKINEDKAFCETHQNKYPVINLTLRNARGDSWQSCLLHLSKLMSEVYEKHDYLLDSERLKNYDKSFIEKIILEKGSEVDIEHSLFKLSRYLTKHFDQPTIILLDEYDTPVIAGYKSDYYSKVIPFMQVFMGATFKDNDNMRKGLITGIMRIARESIFSEMNNIGVYSITSYSFSEQFGFTEEETKAALTYFGLGEQFEDVKKWYNGYVFGNIAQIYNPWSILNYIARNEEGFKPYWVNTGTDVLIKSRIIEEDKDKTYNTLQELISGQNIEKAINESFIFSDFETNRELLWTLLTFSGYLTQVKNVKENVYELRIPNYEIRRVFKNIIIDWFSVKHKVARQLLDETTQHLVNNRLKEFEKGFKQIIGDTFSYFDTQGEAEKVYQAYVLGLLAIIGDDYIIRSNRESGDGRYDIMMIPKDKLQYGVVMELKQLKKIKNEKPSGLHQRINTSLEEAKNQIETNQYYKELEAHQIEKIIKLPIVFIGKEPYMFPFQEQ